MESTLLSGIFEISTRTCSLVKYNKSSNKLTCVLKGNVLSKPTN